jgi:hypothetical protein
MVARQASACFGRPLAGPTLPIRHCPVSRSVVLAAHTCTLPTLRFPHICRRQCSQGWRSIQAAPFLGRREAVCRFCYACAPSKRHTKKKVSTLILTIARIWRRVVIRTGLDGPCTTTSTHTSFKLFVSGRVRIRGTGAGADRGVNGTSKLVVVATTKLPRLQGSSVWGRRPSRLVHASGGNPIFVQGQGLGLGLGQPTPVELSVRLKKAQPTALTQTVPEH